MSIKSLTFQILILFVLCSGCNKEEAPMIPEPIVPQEPSKPEGLYEVITFESSPSSWSHCRERDTVMISITEQGIIIEDEELILDLDNSKEDYYLFTKTPSNLLYLSLSYYFDCDSISYHASNTWGNTGHGYRGRKLDTDTSPCTIPPITNCGNNSNNQLCIRGRTYPLDYAALFTNEDTQRARITFLAHIPLNGDSTGVISNDYHGNILSFSIPFTGMDNLANTYTFSDDNLSAYFYEDSEFPNQGIPKSYYFFDRGSLKIEKQGDKYVFTYDVGYCLITRGTGYFDGLLLEW